MSRFSRSGGNAIGLVSYLVDELKVHLIEVSTGLTTTTDRGKSAVWESLFHAFRENMERKEIIIPNMKAFLKAGKRFSRAPIGYDHYGPRVRNGKFLSPQQKIVINKIGKILKEAWQWKLSGHYSDAQILQRLANRGVILTPQKISVIWRNPFYCGILTNRLLDEPVKGNWPSIVSVEDFMKVQLILENNHSGYQHKKEVEERPLTRLLRCDKCGGYMVGYKNNQKNLHYYRCLNCLGVSLNARTTLKQRRKSAEQLFEELLEKYQIPHNISPLIELQLIKLFNHYNSDNASSENDLQKQLAIHQNQLKQVKIRFGLNQIDKETYDITVEHLDKQMREINKECNSGNQTISNLEKLISESLKKLVKLNTVWGSSDLDGKRILHKTLFPEGIFYNVQKHEYLTRKVNSFVELVSSISASCKENKKRNSQNFIENSCPVRGSRLELPTFGL